MRPDQFDVEAGRGQTLLQIIADIAVVLAGRVERGNAQKVLGQRDQILAPSVDLPDQVVC